MKFTSWNGKSTDKPFHTVKLDRVQNSLSYATSLKRHDHLQLSNKYPVHYFFLKYTSIIMLNSKMSHCLRLPVFVRLKDTSKSFHHSRVHWQACLQYTIAYHSKRLHTKHRFALHKITSCNQDSWEPEHTSHPQSPHMSPSQAKHERKKILWVIVLEIIKILNRISFCVTAAY